MKRKTATRKTQTRAADGRKPGQRGLQTRERLLSCTSDLLQKVSYRDLKVIDIARCAGTSPATFYQYFPDVEAAILALAQDMTANGTALTSLTHPPAWKGKDGVRTAMELVDGFLGLWDKHGALLRVVELATLEGDLRFQNIRTHLLNEITLGLGNVVREFKANHPKDLDPVAQAASLVSLLAHVASHRYGFEFWGIRTADIRRSVAGLVYVGVTGRKPGI